MGIDLLVESAHAQQQLTEETAGEQSKSETDQSSQRKREESRWETLWTDLFGFSPPRDHYAHLCALAASRVSAPGSLNGAGYRAAITDPQHQLQSLCFGECCLYSTSISYM